jgi:PhnB protein
MDDGTIGHAELEIGGEVVMLATPNREYQSPKTHRESCTAAARWLDNPWVIDGILVGVDDLDAHHARAVEVGANVIRPPEEGPDGRLYTAEDLEGHRWMFQQLQ